MKTEAEIWHSLQEELEVNNTIVDVDTSRPDYHKNVFKYMFDDQDERIAEFVETSELYDGERWHGIPLKASSEKELHEPFSKLFQRILHAFGYPSRGRVLLDTHGHCISTNDGEIGFPDLMIMGVGPNFPVTEREEQSSSLRPSYRTCVSLGYVVPEAKKEQGGQMIHLAVYARQCLIEQENRKSVYSVMLTEKHMRLCIFDRSGVLRTPFFDFHKHPEDFIRFVLGFCSPEDEKIGFRTSILWEKKEVPEDVATNTNQNQEVMLHTEEREDAERMQISSRFEQFILVNNHWEEHQLGVSRYRVKNLVFVRRFMCGRGTRCWTVFDPEDDNNTLLIKDSWRDRESNSEAKMLVEASGLPGVVQIVNFEDENCDTTSRGRWVANCNMARSRAMNHTFSRVVMEAYGPPLHQFTDILGLLCAFRDAVKGHRNLWNRGILHRDVSIANILYGKVGAVDGHKGILIDLDASIRIDDPAFFKISSVGTVAFLSTSLLLIDKYHEHSRPHDYIDDLQSFIYCMGMICSRFTGPNETRSLHGDIYKWDRDADTLLDIIPYKLYFLESGYLYLSPYFQPLKPMFKAMGNFLLGLAEMKELDCRRKLPHKTLQQMKDESTGHYDTYIGYIEDAIRSLSPPTVPTVNIETPDSPSPAAQILDEASHDNQVTPAASPPTVTTLNVETPDSPSPAAQILDEDSPDNQATAAAIPTIPSRKRQRVEDDEHDDETIHKKHRLILDPCSQFPQTVQTP